MTTQTITWRDGTVSTFEVERRCHPKTAWLTGETYCAIHGRAAGWPCKEAQG